MGVLRWECEGTPWQLVEGVGEDGYGGERVVRLRERPTLVTVLRAALRAALRAMGLVPGVEAL